MNFMFSWQQQYPTRSLRSLVRYCSCHSNIKLISSRHRVISSICSFYYINILLTVFLMIFRRFPTTFRRFLKIFQNCPEGQMKVLEHFPKISENVQRFPKIAKDFRGRPKDVLMIHQRI